jgi:Tfp pilus tip-associated adhesin PilY1
MFFSTFSGISRATDEDLFVTVTTPDALIVLDLSGSMDWSPSGSSTNTYATTNCTASWSSNSTGREKCRKLDIAKYALFDLLDDDNDNSITSADISSLGIRLGLMRYYNCGTASAYTNSSSCIKLSWGITQSDNTTTTPYANIFCNDTTCAAPSRTAANSCTVTSPAKECIAGFSADGSTPLAYALEQAKSYLDAHKALDDSRTCRQKSVIIVTDGEDTMYSCSSNSDLKRARAAVKYAKNLADAEYKVYVVGFGSGMPTALQNTLNWMAYFGGTKNPNATQSGSTSAVTVGSNPCTSGTDPQVNTLSGYAFMASSPTELASALKSAMTSIQEANYSFSSQASVAAARVQEENFLYEASFEPKNNSGSNKEPFWIGHLKKFELSSEGVLITPACWDAGTKMRDQTTTSRNMWTYKGASDKSLVSFTTTDITAADLGVTSDTRRNEVVGFFRGDSTYNLENWKLGDIFHSNPVAIRTPTSYFYDPRQCGATAFKSFQSDANNQRTAANGKQLLLVGANDGQFHAIRAGNSSTDCTGGGDEVWSFIPPNLLQKISPIAHNSHASRSTLASHAYFVDGATEVSDVWLPATASTGVSKNASDWKTVAVFGLGQGSGSYLWSSSSSCYSASTSGFSATYSSTYPYYCGYYALNVTDSVTNTKPTYMWHLGFTSAITRVLQAPYLGEAWSKMQIGRVNIAGNERWVGFIGGGFNNSVCSSSDSCDALDGKGAGKGFFVVDLTNGNILWSYTRLSNANMLYSAPATPLPLDLDNDGFIDTVYMGDMGGNMWRFRLCPRDPVCYGCGLDTYYDDTPLGYTDACGTCDTSNWSGSLFYQATATERGSGLTPASDTHKQIFTAPTATKDASGYVWVYWGTGENNDPSAKPTDTTDTKNRLFGIKDTSYNRYGASSSCTANTTSCTGRGCSGGFCYGSPVSGCATYCPGNQRTTANLTNMTDSSTACDNTTQGWYINLSTNTLTRSDGTTIVNPVGEKMISDPTVFGGIVYFTTHVPDQGEGSACGESGDAFLYGINYTCGGGALENNSVTKYVGHGIGSAPVMSMRPAGTGGSSGTTDIYATASGGAGTSALTQKLGTAPSTASMTNILYWKDRRMQ